MCTLLTALCFAIVPLSGDSLPSRGHSSGNHLVFPVRTDLQRVLFTLGRGADAKAAVFINGNGILTNSMVDAKALDLDGLKEELKPYSDSKGTVWINLRYGSRYDSNAGRVLALALDAFGRRAGFRDSVVTQSAYVNWDETIAAVNQKAGPDADEPPVGNDLVKVYPVRTILSRYLTGNADCVVDILVPLNQMGSDVFNPAIRDAVLQYVPKASTTQQEKIAFRVRNGSSSQTVVERFRDEDAQPFAELVGYKKQTIEFLPE
jgi:hypothetical protein